MKDNKFRVGDWIKSPSAGIFQCKSQASLDSCKGNYGDWELWEPKIGEWCWCSEWDEIVCLDYYLCRFVIGMNELEDGYTYKYEPFIGELPSFLKENKWKKNIKKIVKIIANII